MLPTFYEIDGVFTTTLGPDESHGERYSHDNPKECIDVNSSRESVSVRHDGEGLGFNKETRNGKFALTE